MLRKTLILAFVVLISSNCLAQNRRYHGDGIDNYLQYAPIVTNFVLRCFGVESKNTWDRKMVNSFTTLAIRLGVTYGLKACINSTRPDGTDRNSFPSGHTIVVFIGATTLHREYGKQSVWISVAGYSLATLTALDRIRRNRHRWIDVLAGAALGIGASEAGYRIGGLIIKNKKKEVNFDLNFVGDGVALTLPL